MIPEIENNDQLDVSDSNTTIISTSYHLKLNNFISTQNIVNNSPIEISDDSCQSSPKGMSIEISINLSLKNLPLIYVHFSETNENEYGSLEKMSNENTIKTNEINCNNSSPHRISENSIEISDDEVNFSNNDDYLEMAELPNMDDFVLNTNEMNKLAASNEITETEAINESIHDLLTRSFTFMDNSIKKFTQSNRTKSSPTTNWKKSVSELHITPKCDNFASTAKHKQKDMSNEKYIIHIGTNSSKPNYEKLDQKALQEELSKFGLKKSLRRYQAIIVLEYIYNRTNPFIEDLNISETKANEVKDKMEKKENSIDFNVGFSKDNLVDQKFNENPPNDFYLPPNPRSKRPWCLQPLHIAWHNLIKANIELNNAVLNYTPIKLRDLKIFFKSIDMNFDNKVRRNMS